MNEPLESDLKVDKITDTKGEDQTFTIILKGEKMISYRDHRGDHVDILEVKLSIKCGLPTTPKHLGIAEYMDHKVLALRDRDTTLQDFAGATQKVEV